jgi:uncharacterized protein YkwD
VPPPAAPAQMPPAELALIDATNSARAVGRTCGSLGYFAPVQPLTGNGLLAKAAHAQAEDMAANNFFSHTGSNGSTFSERISQAGYSWSRVAENLAAGYEPPDKALEALLESEGHCKNIMNPRMTQIGVGYRSNPAAKYKSYWVQEFGTPR